LEANLRSVNASRIPELSHDQDCMWQVAVCYRINKRTGLTGELESWSAGELESWRAGELECWSAGVLECWSAGVLECWFPCPLLHCSIAPLLHCSIAPLLHCSIAPLLQLLISQNLVMHNIGKFAALALFYFHG
jgi:hypothetical protein